MNVSTYLEAFLTVYGWEVYGALFLLLMMTGLFIYPLLRAFIEIAIDFLSGDGQEGQSALFQIITSTVLALAIFVVALVPVAQISFDKMTVANHCGKAQFAINDVNKKVLGEYFTDTDTRVPLMPWLAMSIAQGVNSVFYKNLPCVQDVTEAQNYVLTLDLSDAENPAEIRKEYKRFNNECHAKVRKIIEDVRNGSFDDNLGNEEKIYQKWLKDKTKSEVIKLREQRSGGWDFWGWFIDRDENKFMLEFTDSPLIQNEFYKYETSSAPEELKKTLMTLRAENPVEGYNGSTIANNETATPTCYEWWNGANGSEGLRSKILKASNKNIVRKAASALGPAECRAREQLEMIERGSGVPNSTLDKKWLTNQEEKCQQYVQAALTGDNKELFNTYMLFVQHANHLKDSPLTDAETGALTASAILEGVGIAISAFTKKDLGNGMLSTVTGFYATALLIKIMLKYLIPFAQMTFYMFWGIYMIIGGLRGTTMMKGIFMIISLCIIPGLWVVIDHLDDHLWAAMGMSEWGLFNRAMLDITTGMFYFGIMYVVFFIFNLAGGGDASAAVKGSGGNGMSHDLGGKLGGNMGRSTGRISGWSIFGSEKTQTNRETNRREIVPTGGFIGKGIGNYAKRAWSGMQNGWNKWRGK